MLKRRFKKVWIKQNYVPQSSSKTVYFANHNSWWDGLLPLFLSRKVFKQNARAFMEDKQMVQYSFFSKIGAFSVNLTNTKSTIQSLRYAVNSLNRETASLYIYPEGELTPVTSSKPTFKHGLAWLFQNLDTNVDFVPIAFYTHNFSASKPELYIQVGNPITCDHNLSKSELTNLFENEVHNLLIYTREVAGKTNDGFKKI